ncbi:hypothetical protein SLEP1_g20031 [Rubroshorea leprosula]|uniref:CCHC-type domain-containing protein n=1 Tax=Rubroshorea leprosula TaxID=152421 RepID=A0AAV5JAD2_9ROSI|nr:hypothetical protein SLEP1_g20031 [Rubroshorea leprosula]
MKNLCISQIVYPELRTTARLKFGDNFYVWRSKVGFVLVDNGVDYVLTLPKPSKEDDPAGHDKWVRDNITARCILVGSIHEYLFIDTSEDETAKALMDRITALFTRPSLSKRMVLLRRYMRRQMKEGTSINQHIIEMDAMVAEMAREGMKVPEAMQAAALMNSFPESWRDVKVNITVNVELDRNDEKKGLQSVVNRLKNAGAWKELFCPCDSKPDSEESSSMDSSTFDGNCYNCGEYGHRYANCPN